MYLLLRERELGRLLHDVGARLVEGMLGLLNLGLGPFERRVQVPGVHAGENLLSLDHVAFVGEHFGNAPSELGVDVDLVRFDPPVSRDNAG